MYLTRYLLIVASLLKFYYCENINNWAILIDTSAFWFNYRHASNILGIYSQIKSRGIPDSQIILMLAEDLACNSRNLFPGTVVNNELRRENLMGGEVEVDYRGAEVSVENLIRLLTDKHDGNVNRNKLLRTDENSNILIYMTGHGGDNFMKFRNVEEVSAHDLSAAFDQMWQQKRYREILFVIDTCQAASMFSLFKAPNIYSIASSKVGESSYSYTVDSEIGLSVVDRFSHKFFEFVKESTANSTIQNFIEYLDPIFLGSTPIYRGDLFDRPADKIKIFDFVAAKSRVDIESGIEGCDVVYNKVVQVQVKRKEEEEGAKEEEERTYGGKSRRRRVYKIDFEATQLLSNNLTLLITLTFITAGYFLKSTL